MNLCSCISSIVTYLYISISMLVIIVNINNISISTIVYVFKELRRIEGRIEMFYSTTHSTHFIYGYMASDIW